MAPDSDFSNDEIIKDGHQGRPTRRMRVRRIAFRRGAACAEWVEAVANRFVAMHEHLEKVHHHRGELPIATEQELAGLLFALGGPFMSLTSHPPQQ